MINTEKRKKNLLLIGASGGVSNAFLIYLAHYRELFNKLVLLDKSDSLLSNPRLDHQKLKYKFIQKELCFPAGEEDYISLLKQYNIDIVLDLTDIDTIPILEATDKSSVSYVNTAMNGHVEKVELSEISIPHPFSSYFDKLEIV